MPDLKPDVERQATATIRGFAYQCYQTIRAWFHCGPDEELRCEFAEDFDLVRRDLDGEVTDAELNQVKHEKRNVTLNADCVVQLVNNFFRHKSRNPQLNLTIRLCTIADRGKESQINWPQATCGMDLWDQVRSRRLSEQDQTTAINALRSHLQTNSHLSSEVKAFLATSVDSIFLCEFIDPIFWDTGQPPFGEIEKDIHKILSERERSISDPLEVEQIINRLWRNVMDLLASDSNRTLTRADLETVLSRETTARVDRAVLQQMAIDIGQTKQTVTNILPAIASKILDTSDPIQIGFEGFSLTEQFPPLPAICSLRSEIVKRIRSNCSGRFLLWIYGSAGYGKTTITNLLVRDLDTKFLWFRLRGLDDFKLLSALAFILKTLSALSTNEKFTVVLDDISLGDTNTTSMELLERILETAQRKATEALLIISSQGFVPSRLTNLLGDRMISFDMPEMSGDDIKELIINSGLVDQELFPFWTAFIEARTKGHPQLVGAYVAYGKEIGWKFSVEDFITTPQTAESVKRESRQLLAKTIPSTEARELARRLSVVNISFQRDFALAVARMVPSIKEPGHAFELLLGPWIEVIDSNHYCLSPLLEGYAASEVGLTGLTPFYRMTAYAWFLQKKFNQAEFIGFVTAAILGKEEFLIADIGRFLLSMEEEKFQLMAKEISLICVFGLTGNVVLRDIQPLTRCLFRMGLLRIAAQTGQTTTYTKLDAAVLAELELKQDDSFYRNLLFTHYLQTAAGRGSPLAMKERITRVIKTAEFFQNGSLDAEYTHALDPQASIGSLLMVVTSQLESRDDLEFLFETLSRQSADVISLSFSGFQKLPDMLPLLLDRVWVAESKKDAPEWDTCQMLFSKIMNFACEHKITWLLAGAARARMVVSDEYMDDSKSALEIGREARQKLADTHPTIDLAESTVRYRRGEYDEFLTLFDKVDEATSADQLTLERIFGLRRAIMACSKTQSWERIRRYTDRGHELADSLSDKIFAGVAVIAFSLEKAWADHEKGDSVSAIEQFEMALTLAEGFSDQRHPLFHILRLRFGHALAWLSYSSAKDSHSSSIQPDRSSRPFCGMFANFEDPPLEALDQSGAPYQGFWAMLAKYAAWFAPSERVKSFAAQALKSTSEGQWYLAVWSGRQALFASELAQQDFDAALISGLQYLRIQTIGSVLREEDQKLIIEGYGDLDSFELSMEQRRQWAEATPSLVFEPILMTLCSTDEPPEIDFKNWSGILAEPFGYDDTILKNIEWMEIALRATNGNEDAIAKAKKAAQNLAAEAPGIQRLAQLICCASKALSISDCVSAQASCLIAMPPVLHNTVLAQAFTRMVAKRWMYLAREQKFLLGSPALNAPQILEAASQTVPTISECANLLLVIGEAARLTWPQQMLQRLKELCR
jgi:hypothetical protein